MDLIILNEILAMTRYDERTGGYQFESHKPQGY
jgi:hypothetical protein